MPASRPGTRLYASAGAGVAGRGVACRPTRTAPCGGSSACIARSTSDAQAADAEVRQRAAADPIAGALTELVRIGPVMALTIRAEIGDIARFRVGPALACYAGLVPRVDSSGDRVYHGRITRDGSPWLRWALVEIGTARHQTAGCGGALGAPPGRAKGRSTQRASRWRVCCATTGRETPGRRRPWSRDVLSTCGVSRGTHDAGPAGPASISE